MPSFLSEDDLDLRVRDPRLLELAHEILGDAGTPRDGFDPRFQEMVEQAAPFRLSLGEIDPHIADLAAQAGGIDPHALDDDVRTFLEHDLPAGSQIQRDFADLVGVTTDGGGGVTGVFQVTPDFVEFAEVPVGTVSEPIDVILKNGMALPVAVTNISLTGNESGQFLATTNCPAALEPGASCTVPIQYASYRPGEFTAQLRIESSDPDSPHIVRLHGFSPFAE